MKTYEGVKLTFCRYTGRWKEETGQVNALAALLSGKISYGAYWIWDYVTHRDGQGSVEKKILPLLEIESRP
jgi:hypothetical protein